MSAGSFTANTTDGGTYSATFILGERTYRVSGRFDGSGSTTKTIKRGAGMAAMNVQLQASGDQILGTIQAGSWTADIIANRQVPLTKSSGAAAQAGSYTVVIPPDTNSPGPAGFGFGTLKVDSLGNVRWAGTLADGTKVTQKSSISKDGVWPLYNSVYSGGGPLIGWLQFGTNQPDSDLGGEVIWMKPKGVGGRNYFGGFTNFVWSGGSIYAPPVRGSKALNLSGGTGTLVFNGGGVSVTNTITMDGRNHVTSQGGPRLTFTLTPSTGLFRGTVNPTGGKAIPFQGALFQDTTNGFGFFLNQNHSGWIYLSPTP